MTTADSADDAEVERVHAHGHAAITLPPRSSSRCLAALTVVGTLFLTSLRGGLHVGLLSALLSVLLVAGAAYAVWSLSDRGRVDVADLIPDHVREPAVRGFGVDTAYVGVGAGGRPRSRGSSSPSTVTSSTPTRERPPSSARAAGRAGERSHRGVPSLSLLACSRASCSSRSLGVTAWR